MERSIIKIDKGRCNGCGLCIIKCPESALGMIDGKAGIINDFFCLGFGTCTFICPFGAMEVEKRDCLPYDEKKVMENLILCGDVIIKRHLEHLEKYGAMDFYNQAIKFLEESGIDSSKYKKENRNLFVYPYRYLYKTGKDGETVNNTEKENSYIHLHLANLEELDLKKADLLIAADCTEFTCTNFHKDFLDGKILVIACPKLENSSELYVKKMVDFIEKGKVKSMTLLTMHVPCCKGLSIMAAEAFKKASVTIPGKEIVMDFDGSVISENSLPV